MMVLDNIRYGIRRLRKSPGFAAVAVLTAALGIGSVTAMFSVANSVLWYRMGFPHPQQLVAVQEVTSKGPEFGVSVANFREYSAQQKTFDALSLWSSQSVNLTGREHPERVIGSFVSANFFDMLGAKAMLGRTFRNGEDVPGSGNVAVVSHAAWEKQFGSDGSLLGKNVTLNGEPYEVIGILPNEFHFPFGEFDVYTTIQHYPNYTLDRANRAQMMLGRMREGVTRNEAVADFNVVAHRLAQEDPVNSKNIQIQISGLKDIVTETIKPTLLILLGAVGVLLLIGCSNLANLLLARGTQAGREIAIRTALGARRSYLVSQLMTEALIVAVSGGVVGLWIAYWGVALLLKLAPPGLSLSSAMDARVLAFAFAISLVTGLLFGSLPAVQLSKSGASGALAAVGRNAGATHNWVRAALVVVQVGMAMMLLVGAGLLVKSFRVLLAENPGFRVDKLLSLEYRVPKKKYPTTAAQWSFHQQVIESIQHVPGVVSVAAVQAVPLSGNSARVAVVPEGPAVQPGTEPRELAHIVSSDYFVTMSIPVLRGRAFTPQDNAAAPAVVLVNRAFAQKYWPGGDPVGRVIRFVKPQLAAGMGGGPQQATIVGVVGDTKYFEMREANRPQVYFSYPQVPGIYASIVVRTAVEPNSIAESIRKAVWTVDAEQPVWRVRPMATAVANDVASDRFLMALMWVFGGLALTLGVMGTYGVISYSVNQRTQEIGIRLAVGATPGNVIKLILGQGLWLAILGIALGIPAAIAATSVIRTALFGVKPSDLSVYMLASLALAGAALLASYIPARRASKVDPMVVLRNE